MTSNKLASQREAEVAGYVETVRETLQALESEMRVQIPLIVRLLEEVRLAGRHVFVMGNGGSGAAASHLASDLNRYTPRAGERGYKCIALTDNMPYILSVSNDIGYEHIFVEQLKNQAEPGDLLIGVSGSGNSRNCVAAIEFAKARSVKVVSWSGYGGGKMASLADLALVIPSHKMTVCEDCHVVIHHCIVSILRAEADNSDGTSLSASKEFTPLGAK